MELAKSFGIEPVLLVAQIVNFLIVLFLLKRFLYKTVLTMLKNRREAIKEGLEKAQESMLLLEKTKKEEKEILKKAQERAGKIVDLAKTQASEMLEEARANSKQETEKMISEAKEQIQKEIKKAQSQVIAHVSDVAVDMLKKSLSKEVSAKTQKEIVGLTMQHLKKKSN